jgi:hypothetical protein
MLKLLHLASTFKVPAVVKARTTSRSIYCVVKVLTVPEATLQSKKLIVNDLVKLPSAGEVTKYVITIINELVVFSRVMTLTVTLFRSFVGDKKEVAVSTESIVALRTREYGPHWSGVGKIDPKLYSIA